jgi:hypothetical protein
LHDPAHIGWFDLMQDQRSRRFAPAFEIDFAIEGDEVHALPFVIARSEATKQSSSFLLLWIARLRSQ